MDAVGQIGGGERAVLVDQVAVLAGGRLALHDAGNRGVERAYRVLLVRVGQRDDLRDEHLGARHGGGDVVDQCGQAARGAADVEVLEDVVGADVQQHVVGLV